MKKSLEQVEKFFSYYPPTTQQREKYEQVNLAFQRLIKDIYHLLPDSEWTDKTVEDLTSARMSINRAIALGFLDE